MNDRSDSETSTAADMMAAWIKLGVDFWGAMARVWQYPGAEGQRREGPGAAQRLEEFVASNQRLWDSAARAMSEPGAADAFLKGLQAVPDISMRLAETSFQGLMELQKRWSDRMGKLGASAEPYSFSDLDSEFLNRWTDIYKREFRQFLNIPQLGLTKFYQEKINRAADAYNLFQASITEFLHLLSVPLDKSFRVLQKELADLAETSRLPEDSRAYYQMWIKILEGHYMTLFKSEEYTGAMAKTLDALNRFLAARNEVLEDVLKLLPVSTHRDMDEINRDIYLLKRRVRELERRLQDQATE
jgi:class III poly(R)-hydroxyalkanoic acid synthase PhaE subunit